MLIEFGKKVYGFVKRNAMKTFAVLGFGLFLCMATIKSAFAALDVSATSIDNEQVFILTAIVIAALAAIWPIRKLIKLANRS